MPERRELRWLSRRLLDAIHLDQFRQHGGSPGVRDESALDSALARPRDRWAYDPASDLASLGAAYGYGLARNHCYVDGNKRVAFMALYVFLGLNGWELEAREPEVVEVMLALAAGELGEEALAAWVRKHTDTAEG